MTKTGRWVLGCALVIGALLAPAAFSGTQLTPVMRDLELEALQEAMRWPNASPVASQGHVYFASTRGTVSAIAAGDVLKVIARNELGESIMATPAIADGKLYVRTGSHLWAFGR